MGEVLPKGWIDGRLRDVIKSITGGVSTKKSDYKAEGVLVLNKGDIKKSGKVILKDIPNRVTKELAEIHKNKTIESGSILVTLRDLSNKADFLGLVSTYTKNEKALITQGMYILKLHDGIDGRLLVHFSNSPEYRKTVKQIKVGATQVHLRNDQFLDIEFPIPPLSEQKRIADKLDCLLAKVDACKARLDKVPAIIKRFRQSVLADATSGKLTEDWREVNPSKFEKWKYLKVTELASDQKGSIQSGPFGSNLLHSEFQDLGVLAIGIDNVQDGWFSKGRQNRISEKKYKTLEKYTARPLDVLITVMSTVGRCCVVPEDIEKAIITKHVYRISCNLDIINPFFLMFCLKGSDVVVQAINDQIHGATRPGINGTVIKSLTIPVPNLEEQKEIVKRVENFFSIADQMEEKLKRAKEGVDKLSASTLAKAFRGELVPQDPNDAPVDLRNF